MARRSSVSMSLHHISHCEIELAWKDVLVTRPKMRNDRQIRDYQSKHMFQFHTFFMVDELESRGITTISTRYLSVVEVYRLNEAEATTPVSFLTNGKSTLFLTYFRFHEVYKLLPGNKKI